MDMNSGAVLYSKQIEKKHYPASITKLLTTLVALDNAELTDTVEFLSHLPQSNPGIPTYNQTVSLIPHGF